MEERQLLDGELYTFMGLSKGKTRLLERLRSPRLRAREGLFLVEGVRTAKEFLRAGLDIEFRFALLSPRLMEVSEGPALRGILEEGGVAVEEVVDHELELLSGTEHPQGVILVGAEPLNPLDCLKGVTAPRLLILDGIQDPGNVGTLIRSAWAFGLNGVIALEGSSDPWNPKAVRASAGALAHVPVSKIPWSSAREWLGEWKIPTLVAEADGEDIRGIELSGGWALVMGNEGAGVRPEIRTEADRSLAISMAPETDSLNVAMAGAILMFALESCGMRGIQPPVNPVGQGGKGETE